MIPTDLEITLEFLDSPTEVDFFAVAGAPGHDGQDGADGAPGRDGADGHTPVITASKQGNTTTISVDGDPVAQILDGATGAKGDKGDPGQDGAKGDKGDTGAKGDKGDKGDTGAQGIQGIQGEKGETGAKGDKGDTGATGQDGHTPVKGTDYWTAADKAEIVAEAAKAVDVPVTDVQLNNTSVVNNGVATIPLANGSTQFGAVATPSGFAGGVAIENGLIRTSCAGLARTRAGTNAYEPIVPSHQHEAAFFGLAKAAGDASQSAATTLAVGNYTDAAKIAIQKMLGIYEPPWELLNDITLTERTCIDLSADMNGTPYNLLSVYVEIIIPANATVEANGYGRYYFYNVSEDYLNAETGRYTGNTAETFKSVFVRNISNMKMALYTRLTTTGGYGTWLSKAISRRGAKFDFGNIVRIAMNTQDYEPAGTNIKIYAQRAY